MEKIRNRTIRELGNANLDPVDKITLAVDYDVPDWLKPAYIDLCRRAEPIREEEAEKLGLGMTVKLARAREKARVLARTPAVPATPPSLFGASRAESSSTEVSALMSLDVVQVEPVVMEVFWPSSDSRTLPKGGSGKISKKSGKVKKRSTEMTAALYEPSF
jgi:hypothetical protein